MSSPFVSLRGLILAISWGSYQNHVRIGIDWWTSPAVNQSTTSVTLRMDVWAQTDPSSSISGNWPLSVSGWFAFSGNVPANMGPGSVVLLQSFTDSVTLTSSTMSPFFNATLNHFHGSSNHSVTGTVPARFAYTPTGLTVARISDGSQRLDWTRVGTYTAAVVQRSTNGGSAVQVGRPGGNAATYTDSTTASNNKYEYRVAGVNAGGQSAFTAWSAPIFTTPAPVASVAAEKVGTGIEVTATGLPPHATAYEISGNGALLDSNVTSWPYTHIAPNPAVTHTYTVVAKCGTLKSDGRVSNTVQVHAAPLAPTGLAPNGAVSASDLDTVFAWVHNPVDTTAQTAYELQYRLAGGAWTTLTGTTAASRAVSLAEGSFEWQVRTKGDFPEFGPWSAIATVGVVTRPGVAIQGTGLWDSPILTVAWTWNQAQGRPQSAWQVELLEDGVRVPGGFVEGSGAATSALLPARLVDGGEYTARVRAATGDVWSEWSPLPFVVAFVPPAPAVVFGGWDEGSGTVGLSVTDGRGPEVADVTNLFPNPRLVGDGTWAEVRRNLVLNPSAETTQSGYGGSAAVTRDSTVAYSGDWSIKGVATSLGQNVAYAGTPVEPSDVYTASAWVFGEPGKSIRIRVLEYAAGTTYVGESASAAIIASGEWQRVTVSRAFGATGVRADLAIDNRSSGGHTFYVDAVQVEKGSAVSPYFDGSTVGDQIQPEDFRTRWLGTPNTSQSVLEVQNVTGVTGGHVTTGWPGHTTALRVAAGNTASFSAVAGETFVITARNAGQTINGIPGVAGENHATVPSGTVAIGPGDWVLPGRFPAGYDGPAFSGSDGQVTINGSVMSTVWAGEKDNSPSTASMVPVTDTITIERSHNNGTTWEPFVDGMLLDGTIAVTDRESISKGTILYRVTGLYGVTGAASTVVYDVHADSGSIWLSGGPGYAIAARLPFNPKVSLNPGRARSVEWYDGRALPVAYAGEAVSNQCAVSGWIAEDSVELSAFVDDMTLLAQHPSPVHMVRTPSGLRMYGMLSSIPMPRENALDWWSYSFTLDETDR